MLTRSTSTAPPAGKLPVLIPISPPDQDDSSCFMWVRTTQATAYPCLVQWGVSGTNQVRFFGTDASGKSVFAGGTLGIRTSTGSAINDGAWHHVGCTYNSGVGVTFYVDGDSAGVVSPGNRANTTLGGTTLLIGSDGASGDSVAGDIDQFQIFNRVLTTAEIQGLFGMRPSPILVGNAVLDAAKTDRFLASFDDDTHTTFKNAYAVSIDAVVSVRI